MSSNSSSLFGLGHLAVVGIGIVDVFPEQDHIRRLLFQVPSLYIERNRRRPRRFRIGPRSPAGGPAHPPPRLGDLAVQLKRAGFSVPVTIGEGPRRGQERLPPPVQRGKSDHISYRRNKDGARPIHRKMRASGNVITGREGFASVSSFRPCAGPEDRHRCATACLRPRQRRSR
jgi:hypothetical protein